jgi:hypothetical protein
VLPKQVLRLPPADADMWWRSSRQLVLSLAAALLSLLAVPALGLEVLPRPEGKVILTISGNIAITNSPRGAEFDRQMLQSLGLSTISTTTTWTDGVQLFEGVLVRKVLERVGAKGTQAVATALNDFVAPVPLEEVQQYDVLLAMNMNGKEMQVSDWGPLWIVYPRDNHPELQDARFNERWVWQLRELRIE